MMERGNLDINLRSAVPEDAAALAGLHVEVWRETYAGMAPAEAYAKLDLSRRLDYWTRTLAGGDPAAGAILAERKGQIAGVISFGPAGHPALGPGAEIKHFYVRKSARGSGVGRRLLGAAFDHLHAAGWAGVALAVVQENTAARDVYRALGGTEAGGFTDPGPLWRSSNIVVRWDLAGDGRSAALH